MGFFVERPRDPRPAEAAPDDAKRLRHPRGNETPSVLVADGLAAVVGSLVASAVGLFLIGAAITLLTGRSALTFGVRQLSFGLAAALATYGIGRLLGVAVGSPGSATGGNPPVAWRAT